MTQALSASRPRTACHVPGSLPQVTPLATMTLLPPGRDERALQTIPTADIPNDGGSNCMTSGVGAENCGTCPSGLTEALYDGVAT